jgi:hypothetical protein
VVANTASPISRVASTAACMGRIPFSSTKRTMFSSTTMASSMTMPTARARASRVMVSRVKPWARIRANVPTMEMGIARAAMMVLRRLPRNTKTTRAAKMAPRIRCSRTAATLVRMVRELSRRISSFTPVFAKVGASSSMRSRKASTTATVLASLCLLIDSTTAGSPLLMARVSPSSCPSSTRATSDTRMG